MNVLKTHLRVTVETLLAKGLSQREVSKKTGVDRKTIRRLARGSPGSNSPTPAPGEFQNPPPWPPAPVVLSACAAHGEWIAAQVALGRNARAIYQELVDRFGFGHGYNSVKRFVHRLKAREPERFDVLESLPGEEAQVDLGEGALTLHASGKYRKPLLFVLTLKYSGKSFRKVAWKVDQETWARLHEEAFRSFGGVPEYVVLDNLKQGVLRPDIYAPEINPVYASMLSHYGAVADPCRVADPNRKGTVESAIQHTQNTALKGLRFESVEAQNAHLAQWEERWAAPRIHGRKKRQVLAMFQEEQPHLRPLPARSMRYFRQEVRTVDDAGLVQVKGAYYSALPAPLHREVTVRIYAEEIEILDATGSVLRRHAKAARKGAFVMEKADRLYNPSRETARQLEKCARIGPNCGRLSQEIFARLGRPGQRAIDGLVSLARHHPREEIERACTQVLSLAEPSYQAVRRVLERRTPAPAPLLQQHGDDIRDIDEYRRAWEQLATRSVH